MAFLPQALGAQQYPQTQQPVDPGLLSMEPIESAPLIPRAMSVPPSPHLAHALNTAQTMGGPVAPPVPEVDPQQVIQQHEMGKLQKDYEKDADPYGSPDNHPGFFGKLAHGLSVLSGGPARRQTEEQGLAKSLNEGAGDIAKNAYMGAETGKTKEEAAEVQQRTAASTPVEITPEQAEQMGAPELAGEKVSPAIMAQLSKQHGINTTKENTTQDTNETKKEINQNTVQGRENVAGTQAASREKVAAESAAVRQSLERMRIASGIGKGAQGSTMTTRAMAEMATTVLPRMTAISGEVDRLANEIGPAVGRWNELMVNKGGADHPEFAHLDTDLDLLASAIVRTHFGARGGQQYRQELRKQFGEAQSPEDLKARIAAAQDWIQGYADMEQHPAGSQPQGGGKMIRALDDKGILHEAPEGTPLPKGWKPQ